MTTLVIVFVGGYVFHLLYKVLDKCFSFIGDLRRKKKEESGDV